MDLPSSIRIAVLGDEGVGKTSLVTTLVSTVFPDTVPDVLQEVRIARDDVLVVVADTDGCEFEREKCDCLLVVFDLLDDDSFVRVQDFWLPELTCAFEGIPIVLVGNKCDDDIAVLGKSVVDGVLGKFASVDAYIEVSAKHNTKVVEAFGYAQHAATYPLALLYDVASQGLTAATMVALNRIFRCADVDKDGLLNDGELNDLQERCFGVRLDASEMSNLKAVLCSADPASVERDCITAVGFRNLHKLFVEKNKTETCYVALSAFGYTRADGLRAVYKENSPNGKRYELSERTIALLRKTYTQHAVGEIASTLPGGVYPWGDKWLGSVTDAPTASAFEAAFRAYCRIEPLKCAQVCEFIGCGDALVEVIDDTPKHTFFVDALCEDPRFELVKRACEVDDGIGFVRVGATDGLILSTTPSPFTPDAAVLAFDVSGSDLSYIEGVAASLPPTVPLIYLGYHSTPTEDGDTKARALAACLEKSLASPELLDYSKLDAFMKLLTRVASDPETARPVDEATRVSRARARYARAALRISAVVAVCGGIAFAGYKYTSSRRSTTDS